MQPRPLEGRHRSAEEPVPGEHKAGSRHLRRGAVWRACTEPGGLRTAQGTGLTPPAPLLCPPVPFLWLPRFSAALLCVQGAQDDRYNTSGP